MGQALFQGIGDSSMNKRKKNPCYQLLVSNRIPWKFCWNTDLGAQTQDSDPVNLWKGLEICTFKYKLRWFWCKEIFPIVISLTLKASTVSHRSPESISPARPLGSRPVHLNCFLDFYTLALGSQMLHVNKLELPLHPNLRFFLHSPFCEQHHPLVTKEWITSLP